LCRVKKFGPGKKFVVLSVEYTNFFKTFNFVQKNIIQLELNESIKNLIFEKMNKNLYLNKIK
jgi:hypothetical protein